MPLLPPLEHLHFDHAAHRYRWHSDWLPWSVTQVISDLSPEARRRIEATRHEWEPRGNTVHACLEQHLLGEAAMDPGDYADWVTPLLEHWLWDGCEVLAVEYRLCDPIKRVAGSFDALIRTSKGSVCLLDLKTVASAPAAVSRKPADAQLGAYTHMVAMHHPHLQIDRCLTVVSAPGKVVVKSSEPDACALAWVDAWERHQARESLLGF